MGGQQVSLQKSEEHKNSKSEENGKAIKLNHPSCFLILTALYITK